MHRKSKADLEAERQLKRDIEALHREAEQHLDRTVGRRIEDHGKPVPTLEGFDASKDGTAILGAINAYSLERTVADVIGQSRSRNELRRGPAHG